MQIRTLQLSLVLFLLTAPAVAGDWQGVDARAAAAQASGGNDVAGTDRNPEDAKTLFASLAGRWECNGAFANGKPLASELTFRLALDGRALLYSHADRPRNSYRQQSTWAFDKASGRILSVGFIALGPTNAPSAVLYVADQWDARSISFYHRKLTAEPFAPNRFTYELRHGRLNMRWEVERGGAEWRMGDYLACERNRF